jgi:multiple sugar transport system permease protein
VRRGDVGQPVAGRRDDRIGRELPAVLGDRAALARPALGAVAIFTFLHPEKFTIPQALTQFIDAYGGPVWNVQLAAASLTAIPVLVVFVIAQRQFIEGFAHTGLKG